MVIDPGGDLPNVEHAIAQAGVTVDKIWLRFVASHHSRVQFCWKGVTGMMMALALVMAVRTGSEWVWLGGRLPPYTSGLPRFDLDQKRSQFRLTDGDV